MSTRRLVLLRHAKADSPIGIPDEDRPLSARGRADAAAAGAWLAGQQPPALVLCSPARRTRQTWHEVAGKLPAVPQARYERLLYAGDMSDALALIQQVDDAVDSLLVVGHNPTLSQLAYSLDPDGGLDSDGLRTCGVAVHSVDGSWADCGPGRARLTDQHTARGS